ncbi:unnamed protein product [Caenorhabditis angaria]|uniref:FPL domain-containing protein n=1 Tax=Caenorhabditis angaria TaxID=860376 RepID=A0A9P1N3P4_9PELO|nr:unnamed protein product [Caenorhabditis angaria]
MFRKLGSSGSLWKPKNPHSLEYLKYLQGVLVKNEKVTESNRKILVEALRAIAEILIWGDQNDASVFDFFLERQMLLHFLKIMEQGSTSLNVQLLQTLNILFENIRHETSLYFLLSNNHVNSIISHSFDLSNDEIMAYYISFLKTLSFKLNACTIHFFFNETSQEFPLLLEVLKLYDWNDSMVRIAVRNIILNIVKVQDVSMLQFVKSNTKQYLAELVDCLVEASISLDIYVRSAQNLQANRERLREKVDDLIDLVHYIGELLDVETMADSLSDLVTNRYLMPLLLSSLLPRIGNNAVMLTPVSAFFFFSQFLLIIQHHSTIQNFLSAFLFDDQSTISTHWIRTEEAFCLQKIDQPPKSERVFFDSLLGAFDASQKDDYLTFYGLMLIFSMFQNKADVGELLNAANFPVIKDITNLKIVQENPKRERLMTEVGVEAKEEEVYHDVVERMEELNTDDVFLPPEEPRSRFASAVDDLEAPRSPEQTPPPTKSCDSRLVDALCSIISAVGKENSNIRPLTLELACLVIRQILMTIDDDDILKNLTNLCGEVRESLVKSLGISVNSETLFLEWFEDEYAEFEVNHVNFDIIGYEMLLPPAATPLSGLPLHKRLPSGFEERVRTKILFYLHIRKLERDLTGEPDSELPVRVSSRQEPAAIGDCINLYNSDLLSCTVVPQKPCCLGKPGDRLLRFLVTDGLQLILVEPDAKKAAWAVVKFVGLLQDTTINGDSSDSRALHVVVEGQPSRLKKRQAVLTAKFIFDDHIRCMAAKQRLTKGRQTARELKLQAIRDVLGIKKEEPVLSNPFKIVKGCAPGSVRKTTSAQSSSSSSRPSSSQNPNPNSTSAIPDDPFSPSSSSSGKPV